MSASLSSSGLRKVEAVVAAELGNHLRLLLAQRPADMPVRRRRARPARGPNEVRASRQTGTTAVAGGRGDVCRGCVRGRHAGGRGVFSSRLSGPGSRCGPRTRTSSRGRPSRVAFAGLIRNEIEVALRIRFSRLMVGGTIPRATVSAVTTASSPPAAPSRWPVMDLVELIIGPARVLAQHLLHRRDLDRVAGRRRSAVGVDVLHVVRVACCASSSARFMARAAPSAVAARERSCG